MHRTVPGTHSNLCYYYHYIIFSALKLWQLNSYTSHLLHAYLTLSTILSIIGRSKSTGVEAGTLISGVLRADQEGGLAERVLRNVSPGWLGEKLDILSPLGLKLVTQQQWLCDHGRRQPGLETRGWPFSNMCLLLIN